MSASEATNIEVVRKYIDGCNSGDLTDSLSALAPDVIHYFLPSQFPPIRGVLIISRGIGASTRRCSIRLVH